MIVSFRHKGLKLFHETGDLRGIQAKHAAKLQDILSALDGATGVDDMRLPGFKLHLLTPPWRQNLFRVGVGKLGVQFPKDR